MIGILQIRQVGIHIWWKSSVMLELRIHVRRWWEWRLIVRMMIFLLSSWWRRLLLVLIHNGGLLCFCIVTTASTSAPFESCCTERNIEVMQSNEALNIRKPYTEISFGLRVTRKTKTLLTNAIQPLNLLGTQIIPLPIIQILILLPLTIHPLSQRYILLPLPRHIGMPMTTFKLQ